MVRVLLAVTHELLRAALQEYLLLPGEFICGEAADTDELWNQLLHQQWHVIILDMCMPDQTKLQTVRTVHQFYPGLPILAISFSMGIPQKHWQEAGASGFVSKANLGTELIDAVRSISRGGKYFAGEDGAEKIT
jgi:DNA-binding NarL/FixJ family response regulator